METRAKTHGVLIAEIAANWSYDGREPTPAVVRLQRVSKRGRTYAALKALGACWLAGVAAVFLPLLHFILVPSLLLLGPLMFFWKLSEHVTLLAADGPCPACGAAILHRVKLRASERTDVRCESCGRRVELVISAESLLSPD